VRAAGVVTNRDLLTPNSGEREAGRYPAPRSPELGFS